MLTLQRSYPISCLVGVLTILLAFPALAQNPEPETVSPTYVRKGKFEILPCVEREGIIITEKRECKDGWFTFDRPSLDTMNTIAESEYDCRRAELKRLDEPDGWDPLVVILVTVGIVVLVGGGAFVAGYAIGAK